jgi:diacylglycerol kinase (ATP)
MKDTRRITVIINPAASSGKAGSRTASLSSVLKSKGIDARILLTRKSGEAVRLGRDACVDSDIIVAVGGDGTVNEVARGILKSGRRTAMAVIPAGTGNDFARVIGMSGNMRSAVEQILTSETVSVDVGHVSWLQTEEPGIPPNSHESHFVNNLGAGFDGHAAFLAPRYKHLPFQLGYLTTILVALRTWVSCGVTVWDESDGEDPVFSGRLFFATIGNGKDSAGGYRLNPGASVVDGVLDLCIVENVTIARALRLLPRTRRGKHLDQPEVRSRTCVKLRLESDRSLPIHADGELLSDHAHSIRIFVMPGALRLCVPRGRSGSI